MQKSSICNKFSEPLLLSSTYTCAAHTHTRCAASAGRAQRVFPLSVAVVVFVQSRRRMYLRRVSARPPSLQLMTDRRSNRGQAKPIADLLHAVKAHIDAAHGTRQKHTASSVIQLISSHLLICALSPSPLFLCCDLVLSPVVSPFCLVSSPCASSPPPSLLLLQLQNCLLLYLLQATVFYFCIDS